VGLDPDPAHMPVRETARFLEEVVHATADLACAYKANLAFFEALGREGWDALEAVRRAVPEAIPLIGDGKRGDVPSTVRFQARALFGVWGFDAVTVNAYGGRDALEPFLEWEGRGVFVWCRSSNPGARDLQDLPVRLEEGEVPLYEALARWVEGLGAGPQLGLVVGATYPGELGRVRSLCPDRPLLVPGVGAQGGDLEEAVRRGVDARGRGLLVNASRSILYASGDPARYPEAVRASARALRDRINGVLEGLGRGW